MEAALQYLENRYELDYGAPSPIEIPNVGRNILGHWFKDLGYKKGAEIGVEQGKFSKILLDANPDMELNCVDPWIQYPEWIAGLNNKKIVGKFDETKERLKGYNVNFFKEFSMKAVNKFEDNSLDFVYIDGNHDLLWILQDVLYWEKKIRPGGIISGHDYVRVHRNSPTKNFVIDAVNWYTELKPVPIWFLLGTKAKTPGQIRDDARSWMWVKQ